VSGTDDGGNTDGTLEENHELISQMSPSEHSEGEP